MGIKPAMGWEGTSGGIGRHTGTVPRHIRRKYDEGIDGLVGFMSCGTDERCYSGLVGNICLSRGIHMLFAKLKVFECFNRIGFVCYMSLEG